MQHYKERMTGQESRRYNSFENMLKHFLVEHLEKMETDDWLKYAKDWGKVESWTHHEECELETYLDENAMQLINFIENLEPIECDI